MDELLNSVIGNKYRVKEKIGAGGFGSVYLVEDENIGVSYAAKVFDGKAEAFQRELQNLGQIHRKGFPRLIDGFTQDKRQWIIMEYIKGVSLKEEYASGNGFTEKERLRILRELAALLDYLHSLPIPIVYGDLKPENILIDKDGYVNLVDLGSAKGFQSAGEEILLTYSFAAPEQRNGELCPQSDVYSFGEVGFYLLKGKPGSAFPGCMTRKRLGTLGFTKWETLLLEKCLKENPDERPINGKELVKALDASTGKSFRIQRIFYKVCMLTFIAFEFAGIMLTAFAMEQWFYEGKAGGKVIYGAGILCLLAAIIGKRISAKRKSAVKYSVETQLLLYDSGELRLGIFILATALSLYVNCEKQGLWVELYDVNRIPVLIREGRTYETDGALTFFTKAEGTELSFNGGRYKKIPAGECIISVDSMREGDVCVLRFREAGEMSGNRASCTFRIRKCDEKQEGDFIFVNLPN